MKRVIAILIIAAAAGGCATLESDWAKVKSAAAGATVQPQDPSPYPPNTNFGGS